MSLHHNYIQNYQHQQQQQQQRPPHQLRTSIAFLSSQTNDTPDHDTTATPTTPLTPASASAPTSDSAPPAPALSLTFDQTKDRNKNRKRKTIRACNHCQKSHLTCDENRPCTRCIKRGLASTCIDGVRKKAKYLLDIKEEPEENAGGEHGEETEEPGGVVVTAGPKPFESEAINLEYAFLSSMLSYPMLANPSGLSTSTENAGRPPTTGPAVYGLNPVYPQSPAEVYSSVTEPYKYYNGFHYFFRHICGRMDKKNIIRVSRAIAHFRPSLVALLRNLTHDDLIFMEKSFQRALMEYEKLIGFIGTPTVVWRRSGEIALVGKEFSILTQWDRQQLVSGNKFIFELMDTTSAVVYWEQFAVHAFENSEHAVMSECRLVRPDGVAVPCAFSFTIKRDLFGIPMAIIGNFLPIL
ncbi:hypothetical protein BX661DRAFT_160047 [Kickxella alabastrina]|uniref:uncharacterized protein n=1 Tax=Kickxella alabastrina TaxID=61397 RepID=UPI00221F3B17|nr:uncharacterized protein BX661DRAFT_160047 [Kickxella alabastrina]KAI7834252.1 hypothetical protein BX661DRAFT_160047 [Kickxella alabastrina]